MPPKNRTEPTAPADPLADLFVDELPTRTRNGGGHVETEQDRHVAALIASGRAGLRVPKSDELELKTQKNRYHRAAKRVGKSAFLIDDDTHLIVTVRDKITKGSRNDVDGTRIG